MAMQPISNPSAPPAEAVDDFAWISASLKPSAPPRDDDAHGLITPPMAIPDAIQQQIIYQRIMEQNKPNKERVLITEEKHAQPGVAPQPHGSYMAQDIHPSHRAQCTSSALCVWRRNANGRGIEVMMGVDAQSKCVSFLETSRVESDEDHIATATRALYEQTGSALDKETLSQIAQSLRTDNDRCSFWKDEWRSALLYFEMAYDYDVVQNFAKHRDWQSDFASLHWVSFAALFRCILVDGETSPMSIFSENGGVRVKPFVVGTLLHTENRQYLTALHLKHGGDRNALSPKPYGTLRSTLRSFDNIPKVLRLDVRDPLTLRVLFHRWLDADIADVEDQHILHSLVASVCTEMGNNFVLFDYSSKQPLRVDTLPAFKTLLANWKAMPIARVSVVPTFLLSDTFQNIPMGVTNTDNSEEKKKEEESVDVPSPLEFAAGWFESDSVNFEDARWQYLSSANTFEDFNAKISASIQRNFANGKKTCTFHRLGVQYQISFLAMTQTNLVTKYLRPIRRADHSVAKPYPLQPLPIAPQPSFKSGSFSKWQYLENNGAWKDLPIASSKRLNAFKSARTIHKGHALRFARFDTKNTTAVSIKSRVYDIDVEHNYQRNSHTHKLRRVRQIRVAESSLVPRAMYAKNTGHKWQFQTDKQIWSDFAHSASQNIDRRFLKYAHQKSFTLETNGSAYTVDLMAMTQRNTKTKKRRAIRRVPDANHKSNAIAIENRWEWQDDDASWKCYAPRTSSQIESAKVRGIKKFFLTENGNSYSVDFATHSQINVQTGKRRSVRRVALQSVMAKGMAAKAKESERRTFGEATAKVFCVVGDAVAKEVRGNAGQFVRGTLGPFGAGLYWFEYAQMALQRAKDRSARGRGQLITANVLLGRERKMDGRGAQHFDFAVLQQTGYDCVSRSVGFGKEYAVFNMDQIEVLSIEKRG